MDKVLAIVGYIIPIFGWIIPFYLRPNDDFIQFHSKQSLVINVFFLLIFGFVWIFNNLTPISLSDLEPFFYLLVFIGYLVFLVWGILLVISKKEDKLPLVGEWSSKLKL